MTRFRILIAVELALLAGILAGLAGRGAGPGRRSEELVRATLAAHAEGRDKIRTLRADYAAGATITDIPDFRHEVVLDSGRYARTPEAWRTRGTAADPQDANPPVTEALVRGAEARSLKRRWLDGKPLPPIRATTGGTIFVTDPYRRLLLNAILAGLHLTVEEFVAGSPRRAVGTAGPEGRVTVTVPRATREVPAGFVTQPETVLEFDPSVNYLVRRMVVVEPHAGGDLHCESEVLEFAEPSPGVFVPARVRVRTTQNGLAVPNEYTYALTGIEVNGPVQPDDLALSPLPAGTVLSDLDTRSEFPAGEDWRPLGAATPAPTGALTPMSNVVTPRRPPPDPRPLLAGAAAFGSVALVVWLSTRDWSRRRGAGAGPKPEVQR